MTLQDNISGWPKKIKVERKIVNLLSRSLYADFPRVLRETVSNSYDGDATVVRITVSLEKNEVIIEDNGNGMSIEQFDNYLKIAGEKLPGGLTEKFRRQRIGHFGVGFLACFPFCETLEISSKREGSDIGFTASVPTKRFVEGVGAEEDVSSIPIDGYNEPFLGKIHEHFTRIRMIGLTDLALEYFKSHLEQRRISIQSWEGQKKLRWQLCETLPLDFKDQHSELSQILEEHVGMEIWLNGQHLFRNDPGGQIIESTGTSRMILGKLEFKYAITTKWEIIHPIEARGLKIRIKNVGIGPRTYLDIEKESRSFSRLNWLTGEINLINGLDESLTLTRDSFIWSPEYQALKEFFFMVLHRAHSKVETISKVEKDANELFNREDKIPSVSASDFVKQSVRQLENNGYQIVHKINNDSIEMKSPITLDKERGIATIYDDYDDLISKKFLLPGSRLRIQKFEKDSKPPEPVRLSHDGVIELNSTYPVFSNSTKGQILKRVHLIMFEAKQKCQSVDEMYSYLVTRLKEEFE